MLYREIIAVCSEIHTKHINTVCGQNVGLLNVKLVVYKVTAGRYERLRKNNRCRGNVEGWGETDVRQFVALCCGHDTALCTALSYHKLYAPNSTMTYLNVTIFHWYVTVLSVCVCVCVRVQSAASHATTPVILSLCSTVQHFVPHTNQTIHSGYRRRTPIDATSI